MSPADVEDCADQVLGLLPAAIADAAGELAIYVAADSDDLEVLRAAIKDGGGKTNVEIPRNFRGMFVGTPLDRALDDEAIDVDHPTGAIVLNAAMLTSVQDVLDTLLHEIGHALGYDEDEIAALGLE